MAVKVGERNVPDTPQNRQLDAAWEARELALYTIKICNNKNIFLPEYQSALTDDIIRTAKDIYINVWTANNIRVDGHKELWNWRNRLQRQATMECNNLLALIGLARPLFHLKGKKVKYWSEKTLKTRSKHEIILRSGENQIRKDTRK